MAVSTREPRMDVRLSEEQRRLAVRPAKRRQLVGAQQADKPAADQALARVARLAGVHAEPEVRGQRFLLRASPRIFSQVWLTS